MKKHLTKFKNFLNGKGTSDPVGHILEKKNIILNCRTVTREEAVKACGRLMLESGYIEEGYIQAMLDRDRSDSVALVKKTGLTVMTYPDGIDWNGERVRLVIGIASKDEDHLEILKHVAAVAADEKAADRLVDTADLNTLYTCLNGLDMTKADHPVLSARATFRGCWNVMPISLLPLAVIWPFLMAPEIPRNLSREPALWS